MPWEISNFGGGVVAKTRGLIGYKDRSKLLRLMADAYDRSAADAVLVDHSDSQLQCSVEEAEALAVSISATFCSRQPCFIAVLADAKNRSNLKLIESSISYSAAIKDPIRIQSYTDDRAIFGDIKAWRARSNSRYADVVWFD